MEEHLRHESNLKLISDIANSSSAEKDMARIIGQCMAEYILNMCQGIDDSLVQEMGPPKSISSELTFYP
jgi:nucleotidyltransferase/DNA polymerase involved in DNA repair